MFLRESTLAAGKAQLEDEVGYNLYVFLVFSSMCLKTEVGRLRLSSEPPDVNTRLVEVIAAF